MLSGKEIGQFWRALLLVVCLFILGWGLAIGTAIAIYHLLLAGLR